MRTQARRTQPQRDKTVTSYRGSFWFFVRSGDSLSVSGVAGNRIGGLFELEFRLSLAHIGKFNESKEVAMTKAKQAVPEGYHTRKT